jgi:uncharacterized paraquat-inducible protein A
MNWRNDELRDDEYPDEPWDEDDASEWIDCPECGAAVYEDAEQCPSCGHWLTDADRSAAGRGRSTWNTISGIAVVLVALALILAMLGLF